MNRNAKLILGALVLVMAVSAAFLRLGGEDTSRPVARITVNGTVVNEIDLNSNSLPQTFTYEGAGGFSNTIVAEQGRIRVESAGCPDQVCVQQGWISDGTVPIVCLPNKLIIEIKGGEGLDAANG